MSLPKILKVGPKLPMFTNKTLLIVSILTRLC